jgi:hypothetical protein
MGGENKLVTMQHQMAIAYRLTEAMHQQNYQLRDVAGPLKMAEIGVSRALTSRWLLELFPRLDMVLVDHTNYQEIRDVAEHFKPRVQFICGASHTASVKVPDNSLDLVFIDAQHTYENVKEDIHDWAPKLKDNGIMGGHDLYDAAFPGVRKAVEETGLEYEAGPGHTWWFKECPKGHV